MTQTPWQDPIAQTWQQPTQQQPQAWQQSAMPGQAAGPFLVSIGDVHATATEIVTPSGSFPLREANVYAMDQTHTSQKTPTWAIVLAIVTVWFAFLGLLFLLAKEQVTQGFVAVTIEAGGRRHITQVPVSDVHQRSDVMQRTAYLQMLAGQARQQG